jgi:hypothetical protein
MKAEFIKTPALDPTSLLDIDAGKPIVNQLALQLPNAALSAKESLEVFADLERLSIEDMARKVGNMTLSQLVLLSKDDADDCILAVMIGAMLDAIPPNGGLLTIPDRITRAKSILSEKLASDW